MERALTLAPWEAMRQKGHGKRAHASTTSSGTLSNNGDLEYVRARLAQSVERQALNLMVVGSSPTVGAVLCFRLRVAFSARRLYYAHC